MSMNLLTPANPWDDEDCEACGDRGDWPCDFHQGVDFGYWVAIQVANEALNEDVGPEVWQRIRDRYDDLTPEPSDV